MSDEPRPDDAPPPDPPEPTTAEGIELAEVVAIIVPAAAYEAIDTHDGPSLLDDRSIVAGPEWLPAAGADSMGPVLDAIGRIADDLGGKVDRLRAQFERESRAEASRERVVDRLHAELQEYKNDLLLRITRPIFIDLIQLHDDMGKMVESLGDDRAAGILRDFQQGIEDVLYRQGVEPFSVEGDGFDPRRQRAVSTVATEDPGRNKTIAARLRPGFAGGEKVIRPELVSVFALRRTPDDPPPGP